MPESNLNAGKLRHPKIGIGREPAFVRGDARLVSTTEFYGGDADADGISPRGKGFFHQWESWPSPDLP